MLELRLLGPAELVVDGERVALPAKPLALLALLAQHANRPVSTDRIVDELWDDDPPDRAVKTVQVYVSQLRKALGAERLETAGGGYKLVLGDDELDVARFERLLQEGREQRARGDVTAALATLDSALALWRGDAAAHLEELHASALEERAEAKLALGHHAQLIPDLERMVAERPERERPRAQLMLALYRSGRQEEALSLFRRTRDDLVERLGIEPSAELRDLHARILRQDPELAAPSPSAPVTTPAGKRSRVPLLAALAVVAAATAAGLAFAFAGGGSSTHDVSLQSYVLKVENFLAQSHDAHREIVDAIVGARKCTIPPRRAAVAISRVARSRQSLLQQLAALNVPSQPEALRTFDLLQRAAQASIAADWAYRDWLRARRGCTPGAAPPAAVAAADARASRLKASFIAAFAPLAHRFHANDWRSGDF